MNISLHISAKLIILVSLRKGQYYIIFNQIARLFPIYHYNMVLFPFFHKGPKKSNTDTIKPSFVKNVAEGTSVLQKGQYYIIVNQIARLFLIYHYNMVLF